MVDQIIPMTHLDQAGLSPLYRPAAVAEIPLGEHGGLERGLSSAHRDAARYESLEKSSVSNSRHGNMPSRPYRKDSPSTRYSQTNGTTQRPYGEQTSPQSSMYSVYLALGNQHIVPGSLDSMLVPNSGDVLQQNLHAPSYSSNYNGPSSCQGCK